MSPRAPDALAVALAVIDVLDELGVRYQIGGSFASSLHGVPRQTNDVDLVVDLDAAAARRLAERLESTFYLDLDRLLRATTRRSSANLIHLASGVKVDLFVVDRHGFAARELARSVKVALPDQAREVAVKSPEDTVLRKLLWFREGGEVSDRQWSDVAGVIAAQGELLDLEYLWRQAAELGVDDLLARHLEDRR